MTLSVAAASAVSACGACVLLLTAYSCLLLSMSSFAPSAVTQSCTVGKKVGSACRVSPVLCHLDLYRSHHPAIRGVEASPFDLIGR